MGGVGGERQPLRPGGTAHLQAQDTQGRPKRAAGQVALAPLRRSGIDEQNVRELMNLLDWFLLLPKPVNTLLWAQFQAEEEGDQVEQVSGGILGDRSRPGGTEEGREEVGSGLVSCRRSVWPGNEIWRG
ncbi:MAG: hypothetical protein IPK16_31010 [Anaerolineales bacterium]|nr:hypothetical protein [Anaerolineales bacterium]